MFCWLNFDIIQFNRQMIRGDKRYYDCVEVTTPTKKQNAQQLSKSRLAQFAMEMQGNKALTPSRIQQRVSCSPLKGPLQKAIQKAVNSKQQHDRSPTNRTINRSNKGCDSRISNIIKKSQIDDAHDSRQVKTHTETHNFLRKYFDINAVQISTQSFIRRLLQEYEGLWGTDNAGHIIQDFTFKIEQIFGVDVVQVRQLIRMTKNDGMIGLILQIFKQIKQDQTTRMSNYSSFSQNPNIISIHKSFQSRMTEDQSVTNIKNVVQQFMQTMYQCMQNQIYSKFNVQMRRMVLKYRQAQRLLKKVNEKLTLHADIFQLQKKYAFLEKNYECKLQQLKKSKEKVEANLQREKEISQNLKAQRLKMVQQNAKLQENLEKYQNAILNKALDNIPNAEMIMSRRVSGLADRTNDYMNIPYSIHPEPFKVQIDTHITHKQFAPPQMKTITTVHQNNISPKKQLFDTNYGQRTSQGSLGLGRPSYSNSPYQPKSPYR